LVGLNDGGDGERVRVPLLVWLFVDVQERLTVKLRVRENVNDGGVRVVLERDGLAEPVILPV